MKKNILVKMLLIGAVASVGAFADIEVYISNDALSFDANADKIKIKIVAPDDKVIINTTATGSFTWYVRGDNGAYRYDVRIIPAIQVQKTSLDTTDSNKQISSASPSNKQDSYVGGSVEVVDNSIVIDKPSKG